MRREVKTAAFTLVEILVVMGIISVLAAVTVPRFLRSRDLAYDVHAINCARNLLTAQADYHDTHQAFAASMADLNAGITQVCRDVEVAAGTGVSSGRSATGDGAFAGTPEHIAFTVWHQKGTRAYETDTATSRQVLAVQGGF